MLLVIIMSFCELISRNGKILFIEKENGRKNNYKNKWYSKNLFLFTNVIIMISFVLYTDGEGKNTQEWKKILKK